MLATALALSLALAGTAERKPLLVLVESNPWLMVIGSDSPTFALYDDGLVVYRRDTKDEAVFVSASLPSKERDALVSAILSDRAAFDSLKEYYDLTATSDQPTCSIHTWRDGKRRSVAVYGELRENAEVRKAAPAAFLVAFDAMRAYTNPAAIPWLPAKLEVIAWPFENANDTPVEWPKDWPGLDDPTTRHRGKEVGLYLDGKPEMLRRLRELQHRRESQPVVIGGQKWAVSYRFPFPGEEAWMR